jgi:hypothetical protein
MENILEAFGMKDIEVKNNIKAFFSIFHDLKYKLEETPKRLRVYLKHDDFTILSVAGLIKFYFKRVENCDIIFIYNKKEKCLKFPLKQNISFQDPKRNNYYGVYEPNGFDESKAKEIRLSEFLKHNRLDVDFLVNLAEFPEDFEFYKQVISLKKTIYYYSYQGIETFYV